MTGTEDGILGVDEEDQQRAVVELLTRAYWMEIETVMNYLAASMSQDGTRAVAVRAALARGVEEEVKHTLALGRRIQELHGVVPDDRALPSDAGYPHTLDRAADVRALVESVVAAEMGAVRHYSRIMRATARLDRDTHALALDILRDEQRHLRLFEGYLRELAPRR
ncbi:MAG TPA: ferritin-like domain-containing protein [Solirubrobacteraceae bacterium]|nr:ferritin-like domain-containing protein [Solirubrobacteraceae bacterium]